MRDLGITKGGVDDCLSLKLELKKKKKSLKKTFISTI